MSARARKRLESMASQYESEEWRSSSSLSLHTANLALTSRMIDGPSWQVEENVFYIGGRIFFSLLLFARSPCLPLSLIAAPCFHNTKKRLQ